MDVVVVGLAAVLVAGTFGLIALCDRLQAQRSRS